MSERQEGILTTFLALLCLAVAAVHLLPRLTVGEAVVSFEAPDVSSAIAGAVARPGVYTLPFEASVADLVEAAGGFSSDAETSLVNLAAPVGPGESVFVPYSTAPDGDDRVSVNSASARQLEGLPGVGPVMARRIMEGRPYGRIEDLLRVPGIGERTLERLRERIRL